MRNGNLAGLMAIGLRLGAVVSIAGLGVVTLSEQVLALESWQFDTSKEQLVISLPKGVTPRYYLMAEPARIVLDLPDTEIATATEQSYGGAVRQIRVAQFQPGLARIVMELSSEAVLAPGQVELQQIPGGDGTIQRWRLQPLLANAPLVSSANSASSGSATAPVAPAATPGNPPITPAAQPVPSSTTGSTTAVPTVPSPAATSALPPLEPGAIEIPVEMPSQSIAPPAAQSHPDNPSRVAVTPAQPSTVPTANSSLPIQVDFSTPLPATSAELATANGSATSLSLPSGREAASSRQTAPVRPMAPTTSTGAGSFPIPTADGVSVPSLSTVTANAATANAANIPTANLATTNGATANRPTESRPTANRPTTSPVQASAQPAASPTVPKAIQVIPFGQPLPQ